MLEEQQHFIEESEVLKDANHQLYYVDNDKKDMKLPRPMWIEKNEC